MRHFADTSPDHIHRYRAGHNVVELRTHRPIVHVVDVPETAVVAAARMQRSYPYVPLGCDQQGRVVPTLERRRAEQQRAAAYYGAMAAEAATEVGAEPTGRHVPRPERMRNLTSGIAVVLAVVICAIAACGALWVWRTHVAEAGEVLPLSSLT